jgi:hypothetical protein
VARSSLQVVELYPYTLHSRPSSRRGGATPPMHAIANLPLPGGSNKPLALRFVFDRLRSLAGRPVASLAGSGPGWVSMLIATSDDSLASDERQSKSHRTSIFVARYMHVSRVIRLWSRRTESGDYRTTPHEPSRSTRYERSHTNNDKERMLKTAASFSRGTRRWTRGTPARECSRRPATARANGVPIDPSTRPHRGMDPSTQVFQHKFVTAIPHSRMPLAPRIKISPRSSLPTATSC